MKYKKTARSSRYYTRLFGSVRLCAAALNEPFWVTFEIEPLSICFSMELECPVVRRRRKSGLTTSATRSNAFAVKEPSNGRSGDGALIICWAAISDSGSGKKKYRASVDLCVGIMCYGHTHRHGLSPGYLHGTSDTIASVQSICDRVVRNMFTRADRDRIVLSYRTTIHTKRTVDIVYIL